MRPNRKARRFLGIGGMLVLSVVLGLGGSPVEATTLYGAAHSGPDSASKLYTINPGTGVATAVGPIGFQRVSGIDFHPVSGVLYGTAWRPADEALVLITINTATGAGTEVGVIASAPLYHSFGDTIADISFRNSDNMLYAYLEAGDGLGTLNTVTGALTELGGTGVSCCGNGMAFSPGDVLFHSNEDALYTLNQVTGVAILFNPMSFPPPADDDPRINAMDFHPGTGVLYGSLNDGLAGAHENNLATIDGLGIATIIGGTVDGLDALAWSPAAAVPEPGTLTLLGVGLGLIGIAARKR